MELMDKEQLEAEIDQIDSDLAGLEDELNRIQGDISALEFQRDELLSQLYGDE